MFSFDSAMETRLQDLSGVGLLTNSDNQPTMYKLWPRTKWYEFFFSNLYVLYIYMYSQGLSADLFCVYVVATVSVLYTLQLDSQKDQKLLHQLEFEDNQLIQVRLTTPTLQPLGKEVSSFSNLESFRITSALKKFTMYVQVHIFTCIFMVWKGSNLRYIVERRIVTKILQQKSIKPAYHFLAKLYSFTLCNMLLMNICACIYVYLFMEAMTLIMANFLYLQPMTPTSKQSFDLEQEKMLPGVVMAVEGQVFDMLYQLADLDESRCVRNEELQSNIAQMNE